MNIRLAAYLIGQAHADIVSSGGRVNNMRIIAGNARQFGRRRVDS